MQLHVRTGNAPIDFHGDSTVDVALYYAESHVSGLTSRKFMDEATLPVCSPEYAQKHDLIGHPENLPACTLLHDSAAWHYAATTAEWQEWADRNHVDISNCLNFVTFDHTYGASVAASHGLGVALGRCSLIAPLLAEQKLVTPFPDLGVPLLLRRLAPSYQSFPQAPGLPGLAGRKRPAEQCGSCPPDARLAGRDI